MRFDVPGHARLRAAVIARRQRAWDSERPDVDGATPPGPRMPLTALAILFAAFWLALLAWLAWQWIRP